MNAAATVHHLPVTQQQSATPPALSTLTSFAVSIPEMKQQVNLIQHIMKEVMRDGEHFGVIPGCGDKPALLKPGAEKLMLTFRLANDVETEVIDMGNGHREYRIKVTLYSPTGQRLGTGVGSCSTMEGKYRFRTGPVEITAKEVPKGYWDIRKENPTKAQELIGGRGFSAKKGPDGRWMIAVQGEKVEHDNPADYYNTVLKMAKKRALVDAVLTSTAASDIFTQDIEEDPELYAPPQTPMYQPPAQQTAPTPPVKQQTYQEPAQPEDAQITSEPTTVVHEEPVKAVADDNVAINNPNELISALKGRQIPFEIRDNAVAASPKFDDVAGRNFVKAQGFKWDGKAKEWTKFL